MLEPSLSRFIGPEELREFTAALREVVERDLEVVRDLEESKIELEEKILDLEKFEEVFIGRELSIIALEKEVEKLQRELNHFKSESPRR